MPCEVPGESRSNYPSSRWCLSAIRGASHLLPGQAEYVYFHSAPDGAWFDLDWRIITTGFATAVTVPVAVPVELLPPQVGHLG